MTGLKNTLCSVMLLIFISSPAAAAEITLRFAGQFPEEHSATKLMREITDGVQSRTGGRISIEVYPANVLGDYTIIYEDLMRGAIDMALISIPSQFDPRLELVYLNPFVNYNAVKKAFRLDSWLSQKMDEYNTRLGVKLLGFNIEGLTGIASVKPINDPLAPESNKGVLVRVPLMHIYKAAIEAQGYRTVSVQYADAARALEEGAVRRRIFNIRGRGLHQPQGHHEILVPAKLLAGGGILPYERQDLGQAQRRGYRDNLRRGGARLGKIHRSGETERQEKPRANAAKRH